MEVAADAPRPANADGQGSSQAGEPVLVTFYIDPNHVADMREYLEENGVFVRNVGDDYIEAHVPPALLPAASERSGVRRVDTVIPPEPQSSGNVVSQGVALHQAAAWHSRGYQGLGRQGRRYRPTALKDSAVGRATELPRNVTARCYFEEAHGPRALAWRIAK